MTTKKSEDFDRRCKQLLAFAKQLHRTNPSWTEFQNGVFGVGGPFARLFPVQAERKAFLKTEEHAAIKKMIPSITGDEEGDSELPSGKFVVRVPRSMHSALQKEASEEGVSLNQLVVAKLAIGLGKHTVLSS